MAQYAPDEMIWMDETLKDERTAIRRYGRSKKSLHASMKGVFVRGRRLTAVAAMSIDGIITGHVVEGSLCHADFLTFCQNQFLRRTPTRAEISAKGCRRQAEEMWRC